MGRAACSSPPRFHGEGWPEGPGWGVFPNIPNPDLLSKMRFVMVAILAASLCSLVLGRGRQPSVRIVKGSSDKVYLIEDSTKRHIPDPLTHDFIMLDTYRQTERISDLELRLYPMGKPLPKVSECRLVKGGGPAQYVVWEGRRKHIPDEPTAEHFFQGRQPEKISDIDLEEIPRTGGLRSILASAGVDLSITINAGEGSRARANQSTSASQQRLVILSSVYGKDATMIDVTETVKSKVVAGRLELTVSTENLLVEDPLPRVRKELRIEYTFAGEPHIRVFRERWKCSIP